MPASSAWSGGSRRRGRAPPLRRRAHGEAARKLEGDPCDLRLAVPQLIGADRRAFLGAALVLHDHFAGRGRLEPNTRKNAGRDV
jgi:hypothetical protein